MVNKCQSYERLQEVIDWAGLSIHAFAMKIGMTRSENICRIIRNKENLTTKLCMRILETFPQIERNWLVYGEGNMVVEKSTIPKIDIPYYINISSDKDATSYINLPMFDADMAITVNDNAMSPQLRNGDILLLKKQNSDIILYGQIYYVVTDGLSLVRIVRKSDCEELILVAADSSQYDSIVIRKDKIVSLYIVSGVVSKLI